LTRAVVLNQKRLVFSTRIIQTDVNELDTFFLPFRRHLDYYDVIKQSESSNFEPNFAARCLQEK